MAGPTVASAEVDVDFDGSGMERQARRIASQAGRAFSGEFSKEVNSHAESMLSPAGRRISRAMGDIGDLSGRSFTDRLADSVQSTLSGFDDDLADAIVSGDWEAATRKFKNLDQAAEGLGNRLRELQKQGSLTEEQYNTIGASFERYRLSMEKSQREFKETAAAQARVAKATKDTDFAMKSYLARVDYIVKQEKDRVAAAKKVEAGLRRTAVATKSSNKEEERSFSLLGRLTGSRNDFLNIVGRTARMLERMPNLFSGVGGGIQNMVQGISRATQGLSGFQKVTAGVRAGMTGMLNGVKGLLGKGGLVGAGVTVGILAAALLSLGNILTGVAAGLSALTGVVTAFAASLTSALGGALLSVGPMLGAVAAGVGGVTLAITQNQKAFKKAVTPLAEWAKEAGKIAGQAMLPSIRDAASSLATVLSSQLTPMLRDSAKVLGQWASAFADSLNSSEMKSNMKVFSDTWPSILENLGRIFTSVFEGLSGVFASISPGVEKFTGLIADAADRFSDWANSAGGQNTIKDWFDGAWESASKLWDILSNVTTAIGNVFSQGKDTGDSFLDSLVRITDQFAKWTDSDEGRAAISDWFEAAQELASTLGDLIGDIAEKFDEWDTERNREDFNDMLDTISGIVQGVMDVVTGLNAAADWLADMKAKADQFQDALPGNIGQWFSDQFAEIGTMWTNMTTGISESMGGMWDGLTSGLGDAWAGVQDWWNGTFLPWLTGLPGQVGGFLSGLWTGLTEGLGTAWNNVQTWWSGTFLPWLSGLPGQVGAFLLGVADQFIQLPFKIIDALANLPAQIGGFFSNAFNTLAPIVTTGVQNVVTWFQELPGKIVNAVSTLGSQLGTWASNAWNTAYTAIVNAANRIVTWVAGLPGRIVSAASSFGSRLSTWASNAWNTAYNAVVNTANRIINWVKGLPGRIVSAASSMASRLGQWASDAWNRAYDAVVRVGTNIVNWAKGLPGRIMSSLSSLASSIGSFFRESMQRGYDSMSDRGQAIVTWMAGLPGRLLSALGNLGNILYSAGRSIVDGLYNGLTSAWTRVTGWASNAASGLASGVKKVLGISSPSKVFMKIGADTVEGFVIGFRKQTERGKGAFRELSASTLNSLTDGLAKGSKEAGSEVKKILARVNDLSVQAIKQNQRALQNTIKNVRNQSKLSDAAKNSTIADLRKQYAAINASVRGAGKNLKSTIKKQANDLTTALKAYEATGKQIENAKKKLDELRKASTQMRDSVTKSVTGQLDLSSLVSTSSGAGGVKPTFDTVSSYVAGMKSRAQKFAKKMRALVKAGIPAGMIQQIAGLGMDGAIEVANALLAGSPKQIRALSKDFAAFEAAAGNIGKTAANAMYKSGIEAQKGLIKGMTADTGSLKKAAKKFTDRLTKYVRKNLGIKSPSRVFATIGQQLMAGLAGGINSGAREAVKAAGSVMAQLSGVGGGGTIVGPTMRSGYMAGAGTMVAGPSRSVVVQPGAIQVNTPVADPRLVASQVLDRLAVRVG